MKQTPYRIAVCFLALVLLCAGVLCVCIRRKNSRGSEQFRDDSFTRLSAVNIAYLPSVIEEAEYALTCTGMCYDPVNHSLWIGNYGAASLDAESIYPSIIEVDFETGEIITVLPLSFLEETTANIQGVAYDPADDTLWFTDSADIYHIDKAGNLLSRLSAGEYKDSVPNGIACAPDGSLWVLFYRDYLIHYDKSGHEIAVINCNYESQDHITCDSSGQIWISAGADYSGDKNYVLRLDETTGRIAEGYIVEQSYAVEGIVIKDHSLYVINDGEYHDAKIRQNYIARYELEEKL